MFTVNETYTYSEFYAAVRISKFSIVEGDGIDGVTNSFAATIWVIDFALIALKHSLFDISYYSSGEFQRALGVAPDYTPNSAYLGLVFLSLIRNEGPSVVDATISGASQNIKIYTFSSYLKKKIVILNKDMNTSLNTTVKIMVQSSKNEKLKCTYLTAPSFSSKIEDIRMGGYTYVGGSNLPKGKYATKDYIYDTNDHSYYVNIKYAESALCEVTNVNTHIPAG